MPKYIAAIDQAPPAPAVFYSTTAGTFSPRTRRNQQIYPRLGWVEHNALEIWEHTQHVIRGAQKKFSAAVSEIAAIGVTDQRETTTSR